MIYEKIIKPIISLCNARERKFLGDVDIYFAVVSDSCKFLDAHKMYLEMIGDNRELDHNLYALAANNNYKLDQDKHRNLTNSIKIRLIKHYIAKTTVFVSDLLNSNYTLFGMIFDVDQLADEIRKSSIIFKNIHHLKLFVKGLEKEKEYTNTLLNLKIEFSDVFTEEFYKYVEMLSPEDSEGLIKIPTKSANHFNDLLSLDFSDIGEIRSLVYNLARDLYKSRNKV